VPTSAGGCFVVDLGDPAAGEPECSGSKAAGLAIARRSGIPVIPGFVLTTAGHARFLRAGRRISAELAAELHDAWASLSRNGAVALVVRSSSTVEDIGASSMAGRFRSLLDVQGWEAFQNAVVSVLQSADEVADGAEPSPMGVLVQHFLRASRGGVLFGIDPVTGDGRHVVVEAVAGGPDSLVSGRVSAQHYVLTHRGRVVTVDHRPRHLFSVNGHNGRLLGNRELRALARLAGRTHEAFGGPQDVEWAFDDVGSLLLLQSRPVTATGVTVDAAGPVLGPGPVAETFPEPLGPLESDLWITPLRNGVAAALRETRAVSVTTLQTSPVVTTIHGRATADLELFGYVPTPRVLALLDPRPRLRRLAAAWHVGRLRAVLPSRADALVEEVDDWLAAVDIAGAGDDQLLDLLDSCTALLERLHHEEVLAGTILPKATRTAASLALTTLAEHGGEELDDYALVRRYPILLSLVPPSSAAPLTLPPPTTVMSRTGRGVEERPRTAGADPPSGAVGSGAHGEGRVGARSATVGARRARRRGLDRAPGQDVPEGGRCDRSGSRRHARPANRGRGCGILPSTTRTVPARRIRRGRAVGPYRREVGLGSGCGRRTWCGVRRCTVPCATHRLPVTCWSSVSCSPDSRPGCPAWPDWWPRPAAPFPIWPSSPASTAYPRSSPSTTPSAAFRPAHNSSSTARPAT
jgi:pyruvate,water dikinase